jgi:predicted phosphodiesterase
MRRLLNFARRRPFIVFLLVALVATAAALGFAAAIAVPEIGEPATFASPPAGEPLWKFGFVGDTQQADDRLEPLMASFERHGVEFVLHLGDMVDEATSDLEWDRLISAALKHRVRLMPVVGNHDFRRDYADDGSSRFRQYFPDLPSTFYHFRHRGVNFLMCNSERSLVCGSEQAAFLKWNLEHHPGTTIVSMHRPTYPVSDRDRLSMYWRRVWLHGAVRNRDVVAVFAGHNHYFERTKPLDGVTYVTSGGGGGVLREADEAGDARTGKTITGQNHFGIAAVYGDRIVVTVYGLDDRQLDEFALPLRPTTHKQGGYHNPHGMELPPLADLPQYRREALDQQMRERLQMPRPW